MSTLSGLKFKVKALKKSREIIHQNDLADK